MNDISQFARKVYSIVARIPLGEVRTYKWVAGKAGKPKAARAVGQLMKKNPYPLIIPCHRVVASGGKLGGYAYGLDKKRALLALEQDIRATLLRR
jgi:O-6-methylguanine DNA methyltransferase